MASTVGDIVDPMLIDEDPNMVTPKPTKRGKVIVLKVQDKKERAPEATASRPADDTVDAPGCVRQAPKARPLSKVKGDSSQASWTEVRKLVIS